MSRKTKVVHYDDDILERDIKSMLAVFLRKIYRERGISIDLFSVLCNNWISVISKNKKVSIKDLSGQKANLRKELLTNSMTWSVFIKGLLLIGTEHLRITMDVTGSHPNNKGNSTQHTLNIDLSDMVQEFILEDKNKNEQDD